MEETTYSQIEALLSILGSVKQKFLFPELRGWAASPDFIKELFKVLMEKSSIKKEITILELGSGASTYFISNLIKNHNINAKFISVDHSIDFLKKTQKYISLEGLDNYVKLIFAPFKYHVINNTEWIWYDSDKIISALSDSKIDILVIDGPPYDTQRMARFPAIPLLKDFFSKECTVLLDDYYREDEQKAVELWMKELENATLETIHTEKGTAKIELNDFKYKPLISICTPTYNRAHFLKESINSAISQNYKNIEIVIVDDGSTDNTEEVVKEIMNKSQIPIKYHKNPENKGRPYSRNMCIKLTSGEYILWLDDDDLLKPDAVSSYVQVLNQFDDLDVLYSNLETFGSENFLYNYNDFYKANRFLLRTQIENNSIPNPGTMVRKEIYNQYGFFNEEFIRAQDYEFWVRIAKYAKFKHTNKALVKYRIHEENVSVGLLKIDTSFESVIKRRFLKYYSLKEIFGNLPDHIAISNISIFLDKVFDLYNAILYSYLSYKMGNKDSLKQAFLLSMKGNYKETVEVIKRELQEVFPKKQIKNLLKIYKLFKLEQLSKIDNFYENSFQNIYKKGLKKLETNKEEAKSFLRICLIMNPMDENLFNLYSNNFGEEEAKAIVNRIITPQNKYETEYFPEFKSLLKL